MLRQLNSRLRRTDLEDGDYRVAAGHWERAETRDVQKTYNLMTKADLVRSLARASTGTPTDDTLYGGSLCSNALHPGPGNNLVIGRGDEENAVFYEDATGPINANLTTGVATGQGTDPLASSTTCSAANTTTR